MKEKMNALEKKFNNLENENKTLKEKINIFENKVKDLENETKYLKDEISFLKNENKSLNNKLDVIINEKSNLVSIKMGENENIKTLICSDKENELMESSILNSDLDKKNKIINWIKEKINKNSIKLKNVFKMTQNGYNGIDFHKYCDHIGPTIILIKTKKNNIFGVFTPLDWGGNDTFPKDELNQTFLFSLKFNKKYDLINKNKYAIRCKKKRAQLLEIEI